MVLAPATTVSAGSASAAVRETAEFIISKFGRGVAGQSIEEVTEATTKAVVRHGDAALPLLRKSGHAGFTALEEAGAKAPEVIKLFARRGDEAIWVISEPKKLAIFIKHGDSAADALIKHPGIADNLIGHFGDDAAGAMKAVSRQSAQRLSIVANDGLLAATARAPELLLVIQKHGDAAMDFIWRNKGSLAVTSVLATFLADPQAYISGGKEIIMDPVNAQIVKGTNWTLVILVVLGVLFLPSIVRSVLKARSVMKGTKST
jgi:hypothetical protein